MLGTNLKFLRTKHKISQQSLADLFEVPRTTFGDYERGKTEPSIAMLLKLAKYFSITVDQLISKDLNDQEFELLKTKSIKVLAVTVDTDNSSHIDLVDTKAEAGYLDSYQDPQYFKELPKINLPDLPAGTYRAFEIQGDSMLPIESGSLIIAAYVESIAELKDNHTYIVISKHEGLVYKRIKKDPELNRIHLISDNDNYLPYTLELAEIDEVWKYYAHISFSDSKLELNTQIEKTLHELHSKVNDIHAQIIT